VEGFSALLKDAQRENLIRGVRFGVGGPHVTHLLFADDSIVFLEGTTDSIQSLKKILHDYEVSSGQKVNLQKFSIFFGKGCPQGTKENLKQLIGIDNEAISERYLGLPTTVGRSKEGCFKHIRERTWSKVKGLKGQGMSKAGKGTLVKSVIQAVPSYAMSYFKLTKKLCKQLCTILSNFWWGDSDGQKKVHWLAWDRMCKNKQNGGLGFRDYECFNQAFLAKQGWRLLSNPDSLCAKVLKARYFKDSDFLAANCPNRASYTWKSIIYGRELLKAGLVWRIGSGTSVKTDGDNWIPRTGAQYPLGRRQEEWPAMVDAFLKPEGGHGMREN
jgi:hypothetical protein